MQADMVGDFLLRVSVLSQSNAKIKDLTLLFLATLGCLTRKDASTG